MHSWYLSERKIIYFWYGTKSFHFLDISKFKLKLLFYSNLRNQTYYFILLVCFKEDLIYLMLMKHFFFIIFFIVLQILYDLWFFLSPLWQPAGKVTTLSINQTKSAN